MKLGKLLVSAVAALCTVSVLAGCAGDGNKTPSETQKPEPEKLQLEELNPTKDDTYANTAAYKVSPSAAVDSLGRKLTTAEEAPAARSDRYVGIFYFLWAGEHGTVGPYDNHEIAQQPGALESEAGWMKAGGGAVGAHHFWGKPMFGYYRQSDEWVMRKHVQMLTDAGVDFLVFDTTNSYTYSESALKLLAILDEYSKLGWNVPKVSFMTNSNSGDTMNRIYAEIYQAHPEYSHLWFNWDGKPMIIGNANDEACSDEVKNFFRIKANQWPNEGRKDDGFPWMEFERSLTDDAVYGLNGRKEVANVSLAQHSATVTFSLTAWYGANDRTRSWHDGANDPDPNAFLYGYNFAEQFEWAIKQDPEMIFITGWNEWVAQRQAARKNAAIIFVDCADYNTSRDVEPMEGGYGDNYYMQMISYIRQYKGTGGTVERNKRPIDITGGFAQWNDIKAYYKDYTNDTVDRNARGFGREKYTDESGRNDIEEMKVCEDDTNVYFFVKTVEDITEPEGDNWMNLFISTGESNGWNGYNFVLNYAAPENGKLLLGKLAEGSDYSVTPVSSVEYRLLGSMMMVAVPKADLGISGDASIFFKWSDNCTSGDVFGFYKTGDAAPIGRAGYYYGA